ncbi:MAG: nucleotide exchange factor GrpE [Candidatus Yanofskybacteria bacterium]|nr:nucleotide exchange factor GrpE [Candidatus Yanofskybacteria bacterium]
MDDTTPQNTEPQATEQSVETVPKEQYVRLAADFENYRKRMEQELGEVARFGATSVVREMVDVLDHLEQAIALSPPVVLEQREWFAGLQHIQAQFLATLKKFGVERIPTAQQLFDPATMEAVSMIAGGPSHTVTNEVRAGYMLHGRVIRPARVIIYE